MKDLHEPLPDDLFDEPYLEEEIDALLASWVTRRPCERPSQAWSEEKD